jgi:hypothetical protein
MRNRHMGEPSIRYYYDMMVDAVLYCMKATTIIYIVVGLGTMFLAIALMYIFPAYLYIAMPNVPLPHIEWSKVTLLQWVCAMCGFSFVFWLLARKSRT